MSLDCEVCGTGSYSEAYQSQTPLWWEVGSWRVVAIEALRRYWEAADHTLELAEIVEELYGELDDAEDKNGYSQAMFEEVVRISETFRDERDEARDLARRFYNEVQDIVDGEGEIFIEGKRLWQNMSTGEWTTDPQNLTNSVPPGPAFGGHTYSVMPEVTDEQETGDNPSDQ